jgi:PKD repeat protein
VTSYANLKPGTRVAAGIDVSLSSRDCTVQDSTTYGNDDSGLEAYTGASGTTFRRNLTYDNGDHGIDNSAAPGSVVVSNTVVGNATAGINFEGGSSGATSRDNVTADNAVGSTRTIGEIRIDESSVPGSSLNRDLVFQASGGPLFEWSSQPFTTLAAYQAASGLEPNGMAGNPQFADLAGRDLRLTSGSPAIDAAYTAVGGWRATDHDGHLPVDDPARADTGLGPDPFADLGALEYRGPSAAGTVTPASGVAPLAARVDGSGSTAMGAPITTYRWTCGNGATLSTATGTCTYTAAGTYTVTLSVTDGAGLGDTWTGTVQVSVDAAPVAALTATPAQAYAPQDVVLDATGSTDTDPTPISSYAFTCGNGTSSGLQPAATFTCRYPTAGTYTASVTVRDSAGLAGSRSVTVRILADLPPTAVLDVSTTKPARNQPMTADGSRSTDVDKTPIATYRFDCGNGTTTQATTTASTTCTYRSAGKYTVRLWVTDSAGLTSTVTRQVQVK